MADDWYRRTEWTPRDENDFFSRLNRSRTRFQKAQYLRIQAGSLAQTETAEHMQAAVRLLELLLADYPEPSEIAPTYWLLGTCKELMHKPDEAVQAYRSALLQQRIHPSVKTNAHTSLALLVARERRNSEYDEALDALTEWGELGVFPASDFEICATRALIAADRGHHDDAVKWANEALNAASMTHSGYRYHATVGLVGDRHADIVERLISIAKP